jgi:ABC-2 type transport system permease protein
MTTLREVATDGNEGALSAVLATGERPPRPGAFAASRTFAWRVMLKIKHVPEQLGDVIMIPIVFTVMFTYLFGGALAGSTRQYLQFLLPGTLVMTVLLLTMYTGIGLNTDITTGIAERFRSLPIWRPAPIIGALIGDVARYVFASALVIGLGLMMGFRPDGGAPGVAAAVALILVFAFAMSWIYTLLGLVARTPNTVMVWSMVILFPATMASNVFVDPHTTPGWLREFIQLNPITHLVTAVRGLTAGDATAGQISWVLVASAVLVAVFAPFSLRVYYRGR